nr:Uncharacterised protein [Klebsiella pneumoniae]
MPVRRQIKDRIAVTPVAKCLSRQAGTPAQLLLVEIGTLNLGV